MDGCVVQLYANVDAPIGGVAVTRLEDGTYEIHPPMETVKTWLMDVLAPKEVYEARDIEQLELNLNHYLIEQAFHGAELNTIEAIARHLKAYVMWLLADDNKMVWSDFGRRKPRKPTYVYRSHLLDAINKGELACSTGSARILAVKAFYDHVVEQNLLAVDDDHSHFTERWVKVNGKMVQSSDLAIRIPKKSLQQTLNPLSDEAYEIFLTQLANMPAYKHLPLLLMLVSGLRIETAASFPASIVQIGYITKEAEDAGLIKGLVLSPQMGVKTKFNKPYQMFMPPDIMRILYRFKNSDRYKARLEKYRAKHPDIPEDSIPLFITQSGTASSTAVINSYWVEARDSIRESYPDRLFNHKPHELRATFATRYFRNALDSGRVASTAISMVKEWLGHESEQTTMKYVQLVQMSKDQRGIDGHVASFVSGVIRKLGGAE